MNNLVKYDAARFALQQAVEIDEVKNIRDKAQAMAAYARQANDTNLVEWATEIKVRAERKAGQMLAEMPKLAGARGIGKKVESHDATPLSDLGISKTQSSRWQRLSAVTDEQFELAVSAAKEVAGEVTTAAMLRIEKANRVKKEPQKEIKQIEESTPPKDYDEKDHKIDSLLDAVDELQKENDRLKDSISVGQLPTDEIMSAAEIIESLREQLKSLEMEYQIMTDSRNRAMAENAALKKDNIRYIRDLKKIRKSDDNA